MRNEMKSADGGKKILSFLAFLISAILSPYFLITVFFVTFSLIFVQNLRQAMPWVVSIGLLFIVLIPGVFILWGLENKSISDLHITKLKQRKWPFTLAAVSSLVGTLLLYAVGAQKPVLVLACAYSLNAILISLITFFWKISVHTALFSGIVTVLIIIFSMNFWPLYLILLPLGWARIHRKNHTLAQVASGAILGFLATFIVFYLFGYKIRI